MFFFFPIGHDDAKTNRLPIVSFCIVGLCLAGFALTWPKCQEEQEQIQRSLMRVVQQLATAAFYSSPESLDRIRETVRPAEGGGDVDAVMDALERVAASRDLNIGEAQRASLRAEIKRARELMKDRVFCRWGLVTSDPRAETYLTHQFLHAGYLHLVFNIIFFMLAGPTLENLWGRVIFPIVYLGSGLAAALGFSLASGSLSIPMVGASGAIAGLMGAFLVCFTHTRIRMFGVVFLIVIARAFIFTVPAWLFLPLWAGWEVYQGLGQLGTGATAGGVAHWAHVAGFVFGASVPFAFRLLGIERKFFPLYDGAKKIGMGSSGENVYRQDGAYRTAIRHRDDGSYLNAEEALQLLAERYPGNPGPLVELAEVYRLQGDSGRRRETLLEALDLAAGNRSDRLLEVYEALRRDFPRATPGPDALFRVAVAFERAGQPAEAIEQLRKLLSLHPDYPQRPRAAVRLADLLAGPMNNPDEAREILMEIREAAAADPLWRDEVERRLRGLETARPGAAARAEEPARGEKVPWIRGAPERTARETPGPGGRFDRASGGTRRSRERDGNEDEQIPDGVAHGRDHD